MRVSVPSIDFVSSDHVKAQWYGWQGGNPSAHSPTFNLARKRG